MGQTVQERNKVLVLEAFDILFNKRDYVTAERYWSPNYIQHSAHIEPGREGLFNLVKSIPPTLKYKPGMIVANEDLVIVHGRFLGFGQPKGWIAADILRIADGVLVEHWDVLQDEPSLRWRRLIPRETNESVQISRPELPIDKHPSYLRSREIALKKFSPQGGDHS
jgi:predicted SnoaL-like aldol condensation-catalyzing enzyme